MSNAGSVLKCFYTFLIHCLNAPFVIVFSGILCSYALNMHEMDLIQILLGGDEQEHFSVAIESVLYLYYL